MKITDKKIDELSQLAKLEFHDSEKDRIKADLEKILDFCEKLNEVDTVGIEPLIYLSDEVNSLRDDVVVDSISKEAGLKNAPNRDSDYFRVPKFIKKK
jgi:aspartyl-tRNA(Asn)/glutamyl-tRNA(Gln) amidotransferase subunit C